ncbi:MAG: hypothetical protein Q8L66_05245 [Caulobacter sp.]|nr:hypothetical protein [Caulobacter sp.]
MDFKLDEHGFSWTASCRLPSWSGYLDRSGAYGGAGNQATSDGRVEIVFAPEGRDNSPLREDELRLVQWLLDNEDSVSDTVKAAIFEAYPALIADYGYTAEEQAEFMPRVLEPGELKRLIGLHTVHVHQTRNGTEPYLGFEFGCTWDDEHGLGVLTHGNRVVEVAGSDTARLLWMTEQDAETDA